MLSATHIDAVQNAGICDRLELGGWNFRQTHLRTNQDHTRSGAVDTAGEHQAGRLIVRHSALSDPYASPTEAFFMRSSVGLVFCAGDDFVL